MLTGRLPFDGLPSAGSEPARPSIAARESAGRIPRSVGTAAWADLDVLCLKALHQDPKRRYQSAAELIRDVDHYLKDEPLEARADTVELQLAKLSVATGMRCPPRLWCLA